MDRRIALFGLLAACGLPEAGPTVAISPAIPTTVDALTITTSGGNVQWYVDGHAVGSGAVIEAARTVRGQVWTATAELGGHTTSDSVVIANAVPVIRSISAPDSVAAGVIPTLTVQSEDADGDEVGFFVEWAWTRGETTEAFEDYPVDVIRGDQVVGTVFPTDGIDKGQGVATDPIAIENSAPVITSAVVSPEEPTLSDDLTCVVEVEDLDGDVVYVAVDWVIAGFTFQSGSTIPAAALQRNVSVHCSAVANDGVDESVAVDSGEVTILNAIPTASGAEITPEDATPGERLTCLLLEFDDVDLDPDFSVPDWYVNGVWVDSGRVLDHDTEYGDLVHCDLSPSDGYDTSTVVHSAEITVQAARPGGNVLLIIADDMGVDKIGAYGLHGNTPPTPNIDFLADVGVLFRKAYAHPDGSATRGAMLTGRFPHHFGVGSSLSVAEAMGVSPDHVSLPEMVYEGSGGAYHTAAVGKWHMGGVNDGGNWHPILSGFADFAGTMNDLSGDIEPGRTQNYLDWYRVADGERELTDVYATTQTVDDAVAQIEAASGPWFLWVGFHAPHAPYHVPPANLHSFPDLEETDPVAQVYAAMVEAMDTEIGRLLAAIPQAERANTTVIFVGDNGTPSRAVTQPFDDDRAKGTLYEGGVRVPLLVKSPYVTRPGTEVGSVVHVADLFSTIVELTGVDPGLNPAAVDSVSLRTLIEDPSNPATRTEVYSELFSPNGEGPYDVYEQALRSDRFKLIRRMGEPDEFYDMAGQPEEGTELLSVGLTAFEQVEYTQMSGTLDQIVTLNP